jgi:hypothetical protein
MSLPQSGELLLTQVSTPAIAGGSKRCHGFAQKSFKDAIDAALPPEVWGGGAGPGK